MSDNTESVKPPAGAVLSDSGDGGGAGNNPAIMTFGRVLLDLYPLALTAAIGDFEPRLFDLLRRAIHFDAGWVGRAALVSGGPVIHNSCLYRLPAEYAMEWERVKREAPLMLRRDSALGQVTITTINDKRMSAAFREVVGKYSLAHSMVCIHEDRVLGLHTFLSLYRTSLGNPYKPEDVELVDHLRPHIASATDINRVQQIERIKAESAGQQAAVAISDSFGILQYADDAFADLMLREWPGWVGPSLPACIGLAPAANTRTGHLGARIVFETKPMADLFVIRAKSRSVTDTLTPRERTVAQLFAEGLTYKEVARRLGLSPATVRHHLRQAYKKVGVQDKGQIASLLSQERE